jgi:hypothetical protein
LNTPIMSGVARPSYIPQTAYLRARVDGLVSGYFEWMGAASYTSDQRTSAMHGKQFLLDAVYAGVDADSVSGRLDFHHGIPEGAYRLVVNLEVWRQKGEHKASPDPYRLTVDAQGQKLQNWVLTNGEERHRLAMFSADAGNSNTNGVEVALEQIFEMRVPFELIAAQEGSRIRLRFAIWREHLPVDALPLEGWIDLHALPEEELETNLYSFSPQD